MALLEVGIDAGCYTLQDPEAEALLERLMRAYRAGNQDGIRKLGGALIRRMVERVDEEWENEERFSSEPDPYDVWADSQIELTR